MRVVARWARLVEAIGSQPLLRSTYRYRLLAVASVVLVAGGLWLIGGNGPQLGNALVTNVLDIGVIFESPLGWAAFWLVVIAPMVALLVLCIALSRRSKRTF